MKKKIKMPQNALEELRQDGSTKLVGGFASIKGGFGAVNFGTNDDHCTNTQNCNTATNTASLCVNIGNCFI